MAEPGLELEQRHRLTTIEELAGMVARARWLAMLPRTSLLATPALRHNVGMSEWLMNSRGMTRAGYMNSRSTRSPLLRSAQRGRWARTASHDPLACPTSRMCEHLPVPFSNAEFRITAGNVLLSPQC